MLERTRPKVLYLVAAAGLALAVLPASVGRADFLLLDDKQLTVNTTHGHGGLYDHSRAVISGGLMHYLNASNSSTVNISGGKVRNWLYALETSTVDIFGGSVDKLYACDSSAVHISRGSVGDEQLIETPETIYG